MTPGTEHAGTASDVVLKRYLDPPVRAVHLRDGYGIISYHRLFHRRIDYGKGVSLYFRRSQRSDLALLVGNYPQHFLPVFLSTTPKNQGTILHNIHCLQVCNVDA